MIHLLSYLTTLDQLRASFNKEADDPFWGQIRSLETKTFLLFFGLYNLI